MSKKMMLATALGLMAAVGTTSALAADGAALYTSKGCIACHGPNGAAPIMPLYPRLAGQNEQYLLNQMKDIKSGARANGQTAAMKGVVAGVSDDELAAIAKFLAGQK